MQISPQMGGYDRAITVFSPDGRLFQVEYAREAVKRGTTAVGLKASDGVVLLVDKRIASRLMEPESIEKIYQIDDHIGAATSGLVADARSLIDRARLEAQIHRLTYGEHITVEMLAKRICDHKQTYTQFGGVRPYGTALLIAGVDEDGSCRVFETDPSGALLGYKATAIGSKRSVVMELFEAKYREDMNTEQAIVLGLEGLYLAAEEAFKPETVEASVISVKDRRYRKLTSEELVPHIEAMLRERSEEEAEQGSEEES
ncbi:archaeal proteasome endopeptidase complex subunit alpha [Methermicoccus shengliensis]|uniref:Proteasome subunit alpha n=1 Tax=Methermicoccus shengliensis TaxID=660064 RepID=A0A832RVC7_9EURY|nr:archaeal proteasome endopeptidase complex subunit alpha [Methermicoccus shengliensis]KUK04474.1 MAG: Proteasome subunit alpha [Euryarchaeota archaeon 55_53]KUK30101.1 MAG: Proteasome subunit alpha [Methanosarcinales archeaon 56_1174]MDI3487483.1 proteasome alpha subunit [Methanosarcinales archaeon]MDN5295189.1 proteasome alpha subunit [Methanosarcinales archaeon]HIH69174.1 archaeal proteasome endopeptidase complex subunit alpha [Methermicoccus shengliensis]